MTVDEAKILPMGEFIRLYAYAVRCLLDATDEKTRVKNANRCSVLEEARPSLVEKIEDGWVINHKHQPPSITI